MHRITRRLGDASARRPKRVVTLWLLALAAFAVLSGSAGGTPTDDFVAPGSQSAQAQELLVERFPDAANGRALAVFAAPEGDSVEAHHAAISAALDEAADVEGVVAVRDPFTDGTISEDGRVGYATIAFDKPNTRVGKPAIATVGEALAAARDDGLVAEVGGDAAFINSDNNKASGAEIVGLVAALFILVIAFGAAVAAVVPVVLALVAVGIGLSGVTLAAASFDVSTAAPTIGAMVGLGVAIDYALLVVSRYRENRRGGQNNRRALSDAMATVGSAVAFAGSTVVLAMLALLLIGVGFLASIGLSVAFIVVIAVAAALTLLPALLTLLGDRIDGGHLRLPGRASTPDPALEETFWWRFAHRVSRRPWAWLTAATVVLLALAAPAVSLQTGFPDAGDNPTSTSDRRAYDLLGDAFGPGINGPLLVVVDLTRDGVTEGDLGALTSRIEDVQGVASVGAPTTSPAGDTIVLPVLPTTVPTDEATTVTLQRVRDSLPANASVTGLTAMTDDLTAQLADKLPVFIAAILVTGFLLMMVVFRSVVVPLKAALLNLLSIGAAYGVVVAIFQWGWLSPLFGLDQTYNVISPMPIIFFAVLFGLSVDYEVFLISRIREEYDASGDPLESVARGVSATGRVITSAALIMTAVFMAFILNPSPLIMMIGVGLATAIIVDATVVRMVLVPASMALLGRRELVAPRSARPTAAAHRRTRPGRAAAAATGRADRAHDRSGLTTVASARWRSGRWVPAALLALACIPVVIGSIRIVQLVGGPRGIDPDARFDAAPTAVVVHVVASIVFAVLGAFQFSAHTRRRHPAWHRRAGRVLVPLGLVVAASALWLTLLYDRKEGTGDLLYGVRLLVAVGMGAGVVLGLAAVRRRDIASHRAWMTRAYALGLGAGTQAFTVGFGEAVFGIGVVRTDLMMSAGWGLNLAVAELLLRRPRRTVVPLVGASTPTSQAPPQPGAAAPRLEADGAIPLATHAGAPSEAVEPARRCRSEPRIRRERRRGPGSRSARGC